MSDITDGAAATGLPQTPLLVKAQYTKDLSFENPSAPESLARLKTVPQVNVNVGVETRELGDGDWEVTLEIKADAKSDEETVFIVELIYGGVFEVRGEMPEEAKRALLLIECPRLLFPFARDILSSATRDGGLPPLLLQPMDFVQLYRQKYADAGPPTVGNA
ncbi:MAG: protein-export chaperone SecB [Alphaproteobacteria bacterium]|nr:protein-export chaperone SecB [Alphaproteobacteria bacterium]